MQLVVFFDGCELVREPGDVAFSVKVMEAKSFEALLVPYRSSSFQSVARKRSSR
jgi:hypothetical protein